VCVFLLISQFPWTCVLQGFKFELDEEWATKKLIKSSPMELLMVMVHFAGLCKNINAMFVDEAQAIKN
jgi:hypothetical protein